MGKRVDPRERIQQRTVGFHQRQISFFDEHNEFQLDKFLRKIIDEQINMIDPEFL